MPRSYTASTGTYRTRPPPEACCMRESKQAVGSASLPTACSFSGVLQRNGHAPRLTSRTDRHRALRGGTDRRSGHHQRPAAVWRYPACRVSARLRRQSEARRPRRPCSERGGGADHIDRLVGDYRDRLGGREAGVENARVRMIRTSLALLFACLADFAPLSFRRSSRAFRSAIICSSVSCASFGSTLSGFVADGRISRHFMWRE